MTKSGYIEKLHKLCINQCDEIQSEDDQFYFWHITYVYFNGDLYWCGSDGYGYIVGQKGSYFGDTSKMFLRIPSLIIASVDENGDIVFTPEKDDCRPYVQWRDFLNCKNHHSITVDIPEDCIAF